MGSCASRSWRRRAALPISVSALAAVAGLVLWGSRGRQGPQGSEPRPLRAVEVPASGLAPFDRREAIHVTATLRWGDTAGPASAAPSATRPREWDGFASLDCGEIVAVEPLGLEPARDARGRLAAGDRNGPVVDDEAGDQRVYWRSATQRDWDGVRLHLAACRAGRAHPTGAQLRIVTAQTTWVARIDAGMDRFVSVPVGDRAALDVHLAAVRDADAVQRARVSVAPVSRDPAPLAAQPLQADGAAASAL